MEATLSKFNYVEKCFREPFQGVENNMPSITVPNQSTSIQELIAKFVRGETIPIGKPGYFDGVEYDEEFIDPTLNSGFDLVDADMLAKELDRKLKKAAADAQKPPEVEKPESDDKVQE